MSSAGKVLHTGHTSVVNPPVEMETSSPSTLLSTFTCTAAVTYTVLADEVGGHADGADEEDCTASAEQNSRDDDEQRVEVSVCDDTQPHTADTRQHQTHRQHQLMTDRQTHVNNRPTANTS